jgi:hypothetical protein
VGDICRERGCRDRERKRKMGRSDRLRGMKEEREREEKKSGEKRREIAFPDVSLHFTGFFSIMTILLLPIPLRLTCLRPCNVRYPQMHKVSHISG